MIFNVYSRSLSDKEKSSFKNAESAVWHALEYFPELEKRSICIYFCARESAPGDSPASFIPLNHPHYRSKIMHLKIVTEFSIVFSKQMISLEEIDRFFIICHEFEHVIQYIRSKKEYLYSCILRDYGCDEIGFLTSEVPSEIDADRKAKGILVRIYGQEKVDEFIKRISSSSDVLKQIYGDDIGSLNLSESYVFEKEVMKMWNEYEMNDKLEKLKGERSTFARRILENYAFANE